MASNATINLNYNQAIEQAKKLEDLAEELKALANTNLENTLSDLSSNWNGESASAFLGKAEKAKEDMLDNVRELNSTAAVIRQSAENIKRAELTSLKIVEILRNHF